MKRTKLLKHLHRYGCRFKREGANHTIYTDASGMRHTAIPRHPEIKTNTVRKICKDVNIPPPSES